jgi:hypothetical protein
MKALTRRAAQRALAVVAVGTIAAAIALSSTGDTNGRGPQLPAGDARLAVAAPPAIARATRAGGRGTSLAVWAFRPESLRDLSDHSDQIVVARVLEVRQGPDLESPPDPRAPDEGGIPTQRIAFAVEHTIRGADGSPLDRFTLFRTGGSREGDAPLSLEGDPPYHVGEQYLLFLSRGPGDTKIPAAPDGRLLLSDGRLRPLIEGAVGDAAAGRTPNAIEEELR